jgi:hypothetical protein
MTATLDPNVRNVLPTVLSISEPFAESGNAVAMLGELGPGRLAVADVGLHAPDALDDLEGEHTYELRVVAKLIRVSERWLADQCRAEKVEHVHLARKRKFTVAQIRKLLKSHTVTPLDAERIDKELLRIARRAAAPSRTTGRRR